MPPPPKFLSCDWGTSSFRLRLVTHGKIVREFRDATGVKALFDKASSTGHDRSALFAAFLFDQLSQFAADAASAPLIISGMASSTIGWKELPYAKTPFALNGAGLLVDRFPWSKPAWLGETFLVSGVATDRDVMRGEETQVLGIMANRPPADTLLILPGTHSKHVEIQNNSVRNFTTYMTGELFDLLGRHSVLRATLNMENPIEPNDSFLKGAEAARSQGLAASLFSVRARALLDKVTPAENAAFLSGLLIGAELIQVASGPILIAGGGSLSKLYSAALQILHPHLAFEALSADQVDSATVAAHGLILQNSLA